MFFTGREITANTAEIFCLCRDTGTVSRRVDLDSLWPCVRRLKKNRNLYEDTQAQRKKLLDYREGRNSRYAKYSFLSPLRGWLLLISLPGVSPLAMYFLQIRHVVE